MLVEIEKMGLSELDDFLEKVIKSLISNDEKYVLYDAINERRQKLMLETAECCVEGAEFD